MFKQLKILSIKNMCELEFAKIMSRCNNEQIPERIQLLFPKTSKIHQYNTRQIINDVFHTKNLLAITQKLKTIQRQ